MKSLLRWFLDCQYELSLLFDRLLPLKMRVWGYRDFVLKVIPGQLEPGSTVIDIGGGKRPIITAEQKAELGLKIIGLDISAEELENAPTGIYDQTIVADICQPDSPSLKADMVICLAVLEHVENTAAALRAIASFLEPGGKALLFMPGKNSLYARLNLLLPEALKKKILSLLFPGSEKKQGFKSYYDRCTPQMIKAMSEQEELEVVEELLYFQSDYFRFFLPAHVLYRLLTLFLVKVMGDEAAETFTLILRRQPAKDFEAEA
jgi:2-polyprenyl-6-hydroxyphenyl methylase/3-demethylubiquinone-9 3-methyltransferase